MTWPTQLSSRTLACQRFSGTSICSTGLPVSASLRRSASARVWGPSMGLRVIGGGGGDKAWHNRRIIGLKGRNLSNYPIRWSPVHFPSEPTHEHPHGLSRVSQEFLELR